MVPSLREFFERQGKVSANLNESEKIAGRLILRSHNCESSSKRRVSRISLIHTSTLGTKYSSSSPFFAPGATG